MAELTELEPCFAGMPPELQTMGPCGTAVPGGLSLRNPVHVMLDNLRSAYNVGSMFRTADACGVAHIHLCGMTAHPPHPKLEKTALGAFEHVPWTYHERNRDCVEWIKDQGMTLVGIETTEDAVPHHRFEWPKPVVVVFGNEVNGVNDRVLHRCDAVVRIPMQGHKNSLNVATAFGVILYAILAQWQALDVEGAKTGQITG